MMISFSFLEVGSLLSFPFWYRVVATLRKGIAAENPPNGKKKADKKAPFSEGFNRIGRTGRSKAAAGRLQGRNELLI